MATFVNTNVKGYIDAAITAAGGTPGSGGATFVNTNPKAYIDAEVVAAGGSAGSGFVNTSPKVYIDNRAASITPAGLNIDPPVGSFTEIDGNFGSDYGANWDKTAADGGTSREFKKLYYHEHRRDNLLALPWNGTSTDVVPLNNPIIVEDCKFYDAKAPGATLINGGQSLPSSTITVDDTSSFTTSGSLRIGRYQLVWYTGKTSTTFTGCTTYATYHGDIADNTTVEQSYDGTSEANLFIGGHCTVNRIDLRRGGWMGLWTGGISETTGAGCYQSTFQNMSITEQRIGIYLEHDTIGCTFSNFEIQASHTGINSEWWYKDGPSNTLSGSHSNVFEDFVIDMSTSATTPTEDLDDFGTRVGWGIWLAAGTYGCTIRNGTIIGGEGIRLPNNRVSPGTANTVTNVVDGNGDPVRVYYDNEAYGT